MNSDEYITIIGGGDANNFNKLSVIRYVSSSHEECPFFLEHFI